MEEEDKGGECGVGAVNGGGLGWCFFSGGSFHTCGIAFTIYLGFDTWFFHTCIYIGYFHGGNDRNMEVDTRFV